MGRLGMMATMACLCLDTVVGLLQEVYEKGFLPYLRFYDRRSTIKTFPTFYSSNHRIPYLC
jgi:hypothetical protein